MKRCLMPNLGLDLGGAWKLRRAGGAESFPATVPGCVHMDLLRAGAIEDPFYRDNELRAKWVGEADWIYSRRFQVGEDLLARDRILLRCHGLDTFAAVTINGRPVGEADNMFRLWEFDIKPLLRRGENRISIRFNSVLPYIRRRQKERRLPSWGGPPETVHSSSHIAGRAGSAIAPRTALPFRSTSKLPSKSAFSLSASLTVTWPETGLSVSLTITSGWLVVAGGDACATMAQTSVWMRLMYS
jgi:hypothetical protein